MEFGRTLRENGPDTVGLFYYAEHGVQPLGKSYLLTVDVALKDPAEIDLVGNNAVHVGVVNETCGIQTSWAASLLTTDFEFFQDQDVVAARAKEADQGRSIGTSGDLVGLTRFIQEHPGGRFTPAAIAR